MQINRQEKSPIKQRILQYIDYKGISKYKFYKESAITRGVLDQDNGISEDTLLKFLDYARDISCIWLLFGDGDMIKADYHVTVFTKDNESYKKIDNDVPKEMFIYEEADYFTTIRGEYMTPKYCNGDIIACKRLPSDTFFMPNRTYVIDTEQGEIVTKIKRDSLDGVILYSINDNFESTRLPVEKMIKIAIVIGVIKVE